MTEPNTNQAIEEENAQGTVEEPQTQEDNKEEPKFTQSELDQKISKALATNNANFEKQKQEYANLQKQFDEFRAQNETEEETRKREQAEREAYYKSLENKVKSSELKSYAAEKGVEVDIDSLLEISPESAKKIIDTTALQIEEVRKNAQETRSKNLVNRSNSTPAKQVPDRYAGMDEAQVAAFKRAGF